MSHIGWVDFSSSDREKVSQVLAMLREKGTLDELGIGQIRDAFADLLFPGISTIQTRAKYFITVPRIIRDYYDPSVKRKQTLLKYLEEQENQLAELLVQKHGVSEDGIIGSTLIDKGGVARRPSSVYWNGVRQFGIINTRYSLAEFSRHSIREPLHQGIRRAHEDDDEAQLPRNLIHLDRFNPKWMDEVSIELNKSEAQFLIDKLTHNDVLKHSVLSQICINNLIDGALADELTDFPALTHWLQNQKGVSDLCIYRLRHAVDFSYAVAGAHIRYNILVAKKAGNNGLIDKYEEQFSKWKEHIKGRKVPSSESADTWLQIASESGSNVKTLTRNFIKQWCLAVIEDWPINALDGLVEQQAKSNKRNRSQLLRNLGQEPNWVGMKELSYRWPNLQIILRDIQGGLSC